MTRFSHPGTLLEIPLIEERYGRSILASVGLHAAMLLFVVVAPYFFPARLQSKSGPALAAA